MLNQQKVRDLASKFWNKKMKEILVSGIHGENPCVGEVLGAFNELKHRRPELELYVTSFPLNFFQTHDGCVETKISKVLNPSCSVELIVNFQLTVRMQILGIEQSFSKEFFNFPLTMKKFEAFVDDFQTEYVQFEKLVTEREKKEKLAEIAKNSLRTSVEQILSKNPYYWQLIDKDIYFVLSVHFDEERKVSLTLNERNFIKKLSALQDSLKRVDEFTKSLPFPMNITMMKNKESTCP